MLLLLLLQEHQERNQLLPAGITVQCVFENSCAHICFGERFPARGSCKRYSNPHLLHRLLQ
jgi:hypothetical protein